MLSTASEKPESPDGSKFFDLLRKRSGATRRENVEVGGVVGYRKKRAARSIGFDPLLS